jgi:outer membrane protein OmpA-like peptidoglycan-associated protein
LEKLLKSLKDNPEMLIEIQGHMNFATNRVMNRSQQHYNLYLSHKRAKSIYEYLISNGIDRKRLSYKGMSNFKMIYPIPKNKEEEDMNKRVEIYSLKVVSS